VNTPKIKDLKHQRAKLNGVDIGWWLVDLTRLSESK